LTKPKEIVDLIMIVASEFPAIGARITATTKEVSNLLVSTS